jgi:outer membrane murein-binding lipoprotein Lpp
MTWPRIIPTRISGRSRSDFFHVGSENPRRPRLSSVKRKRCTISRVDRMGCPPDTRPMAPAPKPRKKFSKMSSNANFVLAGAAVLMLVAGCGNDQRIAQLEKQNEEFKAQLARNQSATDFDLQAKCAKDAVPNASRVPKCRSAKESDGTHYQALNFQKWGACETKIAAPHRFGNWRPGLYPLPFSCTGAFLRNRARFTPCSLNLSSP